MQRLTYNIDNTQKILVCLIIALLFSSTLGLLNADNQFQINDNCFLTFNQQTSSSDITEQPLPYSTGLVAYWQLNEASASTAFDSSGNQNNLNIINSTWTEGKYGAGLNFNGKTDYAEAPNNPQLQLIGNCSILALIKPNNLTRACLIEKYWGNEFSLFLQSNKIEFQQGSPWQSRTSSTYNFKVGEWYQIAVTRQNNTVSFYINGFQYGSVNFTNTISASNKPVRIAQDGDNSTARFNGTVDNIALYNQTLTPQEITEIYNIGQQPAPTSFANYHTYKDASTNDTLALYIKGTTPNLQNAVLLNCTSFFKGNKLAFNSNGTATVNIWTNRGQPWFSDGIWNSQNYTTTLNLDNSSISILSWDQPTPPDSSNISITTSTVGKQTTYSSLWTDKQSLNGGGYIFSTNNTGQWSNMSWVPFSSAPCWGNFTLILNSNIGAIIGFQEYANNSLSVWGDSGIYAVITKSESPIPTSSPSSTPTDGPTPTASPTPVPTSSQTPSNTASPTTSPSQSQTATPAPLQTKVFSKETIFLIFSVVAVSVILLALSFKKGYVTIEVIDEQDE